MTIAIVHVGIDLAKNVFALHGVDEGGRAALVRPSIRRDQLMEVVAKLPACTIGMQACSGVHHWARQFVTFGQAVIDIYLEDARSKMHHTGQTGSRQTRLTLCRAPRGDDNE